MSLVTREMIQIQCTCTDVDALPMHKRKVSGLDKYNISASAPDLIISRATRLTHVLI